MNQLRQVNLGLTPYNNLQLLAILMASHGGISNYHAMVATLRNRPWNGLQFDMNYTFANSKDRVGDVQNNLSLISTGFDPDVDYGPAQSDRRHVFNAIANYELPLARIADGAPGMAGQRDHRRLVSVRHLPRLFELASLRDGQQLSLGGSLSGLA